MQALGFVEFYLGPNLEGGTTSNLFSVTNTNFEGNPNGLIKYFEPATIPTNATSIFTRYIPNPGTEIVDGGQIILSPGTSFFVYLNDTTNPLTNVYTRGVVFYWSEMAFAGEVTGVNAVYTMFNPQGHPIRGKVSLAIEQSEDSDVTSGGKYWEEAFDRLFGDYSKDTDVDDSSILDQIGNIINL